jgi:hypothetical protein
VKDEMPGLYDRYQKGFHQEVYDELLAMQEHIYEPHVYGEALLVAKEIMRRVRFNIELIIPRLHEMGYLFREGGLWDNFSPEGKARIDTEYPIFQPPTPDTLEHVTALEQLVGSLPLSLKCWFEEVGTVNLIGLFPGNKRAYGPVLDPLCVETIEMVLFVVRVLMEMGGWEEEPQLLLAPDGYHKYGYSGAGSYNMVVPCKAVDAPFLNETHHTTFVNYLRICLKWGGFPGLEKDTHVSPDKLALLTKDLLPF